jgi:hypothetical protein
MKNLQKTSWHQLITLVNNLYYFNYLFFIFFYYLEFGLEDYPQIIKRPMDLGTVRDRLLANQFTSHQAVLDDIQLIWDNCKQYNVDGSVSQIIRNL